MRPRIYLDNAATSWPKPEAVYTAVDRYLRHLGAPAGRGAYTEAVETERLIQSCRKKIAQLIGAEDERRIIFTLNGTDSLNQALHGVLRPGDHVITTVCEHNSVLRPLRSLAEHRDVSATYVNCDRNGYVDPGDIRRSINSKTRLIAVVHASNVTGAIQPVEQIGRIAAESNVLFLVDAAQSLGYAPVDIRQIGCHLLAAPGHKGLLGPLGTGVLYIGQAAEKVMQPLRQGGTGTQSDEDLQPMSLPYRFESGNLNAAGIAGLEAGVGHVLGSVNDQAQITKLTAKLLTGLQEIEGIAIFGPAADAPRVGVVSFNLRGYDPQELASLLDTHWSIQTRAGLHCAPKMHAALGTLPAGTLRVSLGHFSSSQDIDALLGALREITTS